MWTPEDVADASRRGRCTVNELNEKLGLQPQEDGDEIVIPYSLERAERIVLRLSCVLLFFTCVGAASTVLVVGLGIGALLGYVHVSW